MQDPIFVQAGVLGYCIEEYVGLVPPKPIANELVTCIQNLINAGVAPQVDKAKEEAKVLLAKLQ